MTDRPYPAMPRAQIVILCAMGVILWFVAAVMLRYLGPIGIYEGWPRVLTYALIIPGTAPFVLLIRWIANVKPGQLGMAMSVATTAAMLMDGLALGWFPSLYGAGVEMHAGAGGTILWGAAVGIILGFLMDKRA